MIGSKVCVAAALVAAVGGMSCAVGAADEILVSREVWGPNSNGDFDRLFVYPPQFVNAGAEIELAIPSFDSTPGRANVLRITDRTTAVVDPLTGLPLPPQLRSGE